MTMSAALQRVMEEVEISSSSEVDDKISKVASPGLSFFDPLDDSDSKGEELICFESISAESSTPLFDDAQLESSEEASCSSSAEEEKNNASSDDESVLQLCDEFASSLEQANIEFQDLTASGMDPVG